MLLCLAFVPGVALADEPAAPRPSRASAAKIGSVMALLATLQDADVLPPEGTPEANHVIQWTIQFQSVFMTSDDPAIHAFARQALTAAVGEDAAVAAWSALPATGWTAEFLEALAEEEARTPDDGRHQLDPGFQRFNMSQIHFHQMLELVRHARHTFVQRGTDFRTQFNRRRHEMPGAGTHTP